MDEKVRRMTNNQMNKISFGNIKIEIDIPKFTHVMIITTISDATNGSQNVNTQTYTADEIEKMIKEEK